MVDHFVSHTTHSLALFDDCCKLQCAVKIEHGTKEKKVLICGVRLRIPHVLPTIILNIIQQINPFILNYFSRFIFIPLEIEN